MIATIFPPRANYVEQIQELINENHSKVESLVLAHNNPNLIRRLSAAFADEPVALIDLPQDQWQLDQGELLEAIRWATLEGGIERIVLVGDTSVAFKGESPLGAYNASNRGTPITLARKANARRQQALSQFQEKVKQLRAALEVSDAMPVGSVKIEGLFYRAEADLFTVYVEKKDTFVLLN